ncbi:unnamed protein product, partial [Mesorhabditis belari]|uniref:Uncharacterized protein n=1 Tax=Mesorhabditis belari TaxID=2138241 RepID=A0AAF3FDP0_9BILA
MARRETSRKGTAKGKRSSPTRDLIRALESCERYSSTETRTTENGWSAGYQSSEWLSAIAGLQHIPCCWPFLAIWLVHYACHNDDTGGTCRFF